MEPLDRVFATHMSSIEYNDYRARIQFLDRFNIRGDKNGLL